jgi:hypothetical protein
MPAGSLTGRYAGVIQIVGYFPGRTRTGAPRVGKRAANFESVDRCSGPTGIVKFIDQCCYLDNIGQDRMLTSYLGQMKPNSKSR